MNYIQYLSYVFRHKWFVFLAGLKVGVPLWQLATHDLSKFSPSEFFPYANFFYRPKDSGGDAFNMAWLLHQRRNPHHWQHWVLMQDDGPALPLPMPEKYAREMVADWAGAGRAITGKWEVADWYENNKEKIILHPETRQFTEILLGKCFAVGVK